MGKGITKRPGDITGGDIIVHDVTGGAEDDTVVDVTGEDIAVRGRRRMSGCEKLSNGNVRKLAFMSQWRGITGRDLSSPDTVRRYSPPPPGEVRCQYPSTTIERDSHCLLY